MNTRKWDTSQLLNAVRNADSFRQVFVNLGLKPDGGVRNEVKKRRISTEHFKGKGWSKDQKITRKQVIPDNLLFVKDCKITRGSIKRRIISNNLFDYRCQICGIREWLGKRLSLRLDHINGVNNDNRLSNLRFLCPNCDSQSDTFCGRNVRRKRLDKTSQCILCGKQKSLNIHKRCSSCAAKERKPRDRSHTRKVVRPSLEELKNLLRDNSYCEVGRKYGVSDNAIRKWILFYEKSSE